MDLLDPFSCQLQHIAFDRLKSHTPLPCPGTQSINIPLKFHCVFFILNFTIANTVISKKSYFTWTRSLVITLPKKGNLQLCKNYRTISLISHPSEVMLKIILNRLQPQAEEINAEEQAGFRAGRSTTEQILNLRILCEKYLQHQQNLYHVFVDFKKSVDRLCHEALWATMRKYNINASIILMSH